MADNIRVLEIETTKGKTYRGIHHPNHIYHSGVIIDNGNTGLTLIPWSTIETINVVHEEDIDG